MEGKNAEQTDEKVCSLETLFWAWGLTLLQMRSIGFKDERRYAANNIFFNNHLIGNKTKRERNNTNDNNERQCQIEMCANASTINKTRVSSNNNQ